MTFYVGITILLVLTELGAALNYYLIEKLYILVVPNNIKNTSSYDKLVAN